MVVRWPGKVNPGSVTDAMVEYVDVAPTFVEVAGGEPATGLDGKSFASVLAGKVHEHKSLTYGMMTTRGIINGSEAFGIRTVRDSQYRLIWNLHHTTKFTNACTSSPLFQSMVTAARQGDAKAGELVKRYHFRPQFELYDCIADPLELANLAGSPKHAGIVKKLKGKLSEWMNDQGDKGVATELDALLHQGRYRGLTREEADEAWQKRKATRRKKKNR